MGRKLDVPALWSEQMGAAVAKQRELAADAYSPDQSFAQMREAYNRERAFWNEGGPAPASTRNGTLPTRHGRVPVRMHRPSDAPRLPVIVYIHGGGWVLGNLDTHDRITRTLAAETGAAVLAVDYTLSPEARFPQALEECVDAIRALRESCDEWGIDPAGVSIAGDSGGANLALGAFLHLRDEERAADGIACLLLFYGSYGMRDSTSMRLLGGPWDGLTEEDYAWYRGLYFENEADQSSPYFDLLAGDFSLGVPACYVAAAEFDPLRDDSRTLTTMLKLAGVDVRYEEFPGVIHGFLHHSRLLDSAREALAHAAEFHRSHALAE